jgi:hypothetical protein
MYHKCTNKQCLTGLKRLDPEAHMLSIAEITNAFHVPSTSFCGMFKRRRVFTLI